MSTVVVYSSQTGFTKRYAEWLSTWWCWADGFMRRARGQEVACARP